MASKIIIPDQREPVIDPKTGIINPNWHQFLLELVRRLNAAGL